MRRPVAKPHLRATESRHGLAARGLAYGGNFKIRFNQYDLSSIPSRGIAIDDILITANPIGGFALTAPSQVTEGAGVVAASATLDAVSATDTVVALTSSVPAKITVPASVTVPAGQTSAGFDLTVLDDGIVDGLRIVTIGGTIPGQLPRTVSVAVLDNDALPLSLAAPTAVAESATGQTGTVTLGAIAAGPVTISLSLSDTTAIQVPASVTLQPGQQTVTFPLTVVDDTKIVGVTASAATFTSAVVNTTVYDNEVHHFLFGTIAAAQIRGQAFSVTVSARDIGNVAITTFTGTANLAAAAAGLSVPMTPVVTGSFSSGSWTGNVTVTGNGTGVALTASDAAGHTGTSNTFTVGAGTLNTLVFGTVPSPVTATLPFTATLNARDAFGNTITSYNGPVTVAAGPAQRTVGAGTVTMSQVLYTSASESRVQSIYLASELGAAGRLTGLALDVTTLPSQPLTRFTVRVRPTTLAAYASGAIWETTGWTTVFQATRTVSNTGWVMLPFTTPFPYDGTSNLMVDFSFDNVATGSSGIVRATAATATRTLYGYAFGANGDPLTWSGTTPPGSLTSSLPNLRLRIERTIPVAPATVTLVSGAWTGPLSLGGTGTALTLTADAASGLTGESNTFNAAAVAA